MCPGRSAARSGALQTRDRTNSVFPAVPDQQCSVHTRAALRPGHESGDCESNYYAGPRAEAFSRNRVSGLRSLAIRS